MIGTHEEVLGDLTAVLLEQFALLVMELHREGVVDGNAMIERMSHVGTNANQNEVRGVLRDMIVRVVEAVEGPEPPEPFLRLVD